MEGSRARHGSPTLDGRGSPHGSPNGFQIGFDAVALGMITSVFLEECARERLSQHRGTTP